MKPDHSQRSSTRRSKAPVAVTLALLALAVPRLSMAQAVSPADLVGSWALPDSPEYGFTFRADSTMTFVSQIPQGKATVKGQWRLANDTLVASRLVVKLNGRPATAQFARRLLAIKGTQLTATRVDDKVSTVYQRVDSLAKPAAATPKP